MVLLKSVADIETILAVAAQYLHASSLIRIDQGRMNLREIARARAGAQQQNPAVAQYAWHARSVMAPLFQWP